MSALVRKADLPAAWGESASELLERRTGLVVSPTAWQARMRCEIRARAGRWWFSYVDNGQQPPFISQGHRVPCCRPHWEWDVSGAGDDADRHAPDCHLFKP